MASGERSDSKQLLRTLERWREAELDTAQARHAELAQEAASKERARDGVQLEIDATHCLAREQVRDAEPLSLESLRRSSEFAALKTHELVTAQRALDESCASRDEAHEAVLQQFEQLSAVQKLGKRRERVASLEAARADQKRLDEQGLSRLSARSGADVTRTNEE